jgi:hypothetical protein
MFETEEDELFFADFLILLDQEVAPAIDVVDVSDPVARLFTQSRRVLLFIGQSRRVRELFRDQSKEDGSNPG